jgi:hypothetical protein
MGRIVNAYLDIAEDSAKRHIPMTMQDWVNELDGLLKLTKREILDNLGTISREIAEKHALTEFEKYRIVQDRLFQSDYDLFIEKNKNIENESNN